MWVGISEESILQLESIQNLFLRTLLETPFSTPKPAMKWETGVLSMKTRIMQNKLVFINAIKHLDDDCLAKQIYDEQVYNKWPGLAKECSIFCSDLGLPDITQMCYSKNVWKGMVKKASLTFEKECLNKCIDNYKKLVDLRDVPYGLKDYIKTNNIKSARLMFSEKSKMIDAKMNYKNDPRYKQQAWKCDSCGDLEDQSHLRICKAYQQVRNKLNLDNPNDLVQYFQEVMKIRIEKRKK